jgi:hypothetical protein
MLVFCSCQKEMVSKKQSDNIYTSGVTILMDDSLYHIYIDTVYCSCYYNIILGSEPEVQTLYAVDGTINGAIKTNKP